MRWPVKPKKPMRWFCLWPCKVQTENGEEWVWLEWVYAEWQRGG